MATLQVDPPLPPRINVDVCLPPPFTGLSAGPLSQTTSLAIDDDGDDELMIAAVTYMELLQCVPG